MVGIYSAKRGIINNQKTFKKGDRLLKRSDFIHLSNTGKRLQNKHFIAYFYRNKLNCCRLGITVTRKVGNAVKRNRIKRLAREYFRQNRHIFKDNCDINLIAKKQSVNLSNSITLSSLENIFVRIAT